MIEFKLETTKFNNVFLLKYKSFEEKRGNIYSTYNREAFSKIKELNFLKFNHDKFSLSNFNVFRGFHGDNKSYKLVTCVYGEIDQYILDWRKESETFGQVIKFSIKRDNRISLLIPPRCGNGYYVKSEQAVYHYKLDYSGKYADVNEQFTISYNDKRIKNLKLDIKNPITSERDQ